MSLWIGAVCSLCIQERNLVYCSHQQAICSCGWNSGKGCFFALCPPGVCCLVRFRTRNPKFIGVAGVAKNSHWSLEFFPPKNEYLWIANWHIKAQYHTTSHHNPRCQINANPPTPKVLVFSCRFFLHFASATAVRRRNLSCTPECWVLAHHRGESSDFQAYSTNYSCVLS